MRAVWTLLPQDRWLLLAMLFIESMGDDLFDPDWGFDSYEITIPQKLSFKKEVQGLGSAVSYLLQLEGKKHVLHLWPKKFLLPRHLPVFSFTDQGDLLEDYPHIPRECNYVGSVQGSQASEATLSTCMGGLHGIVNIDTRYYQIEPLKASTSFEHVVYLLKEERPNSQICGVPDEDRDTETDQEEETVRKSYYYQAYMHQKFMELVMVFDVNRFNFSKRNVSQIINDAILLTSIMDTYYQDIRMRIHLKALEIWTDYDRIFVHFPTLAEVLGQFVLYRHHLLNPRLPSDWAHLFVRKSYTDALAWSWGRACDTWHAGSASSFLDVNVLGPATWAAHEVGHSVGMYHDEEFCQCRGRKSCIMGTGRTGFSNCSYVAFFKHAAYKMSYCLSDLPGLAFVIERCGNKIVEDDEECDCGSAEECEKDLCCGPDCRWKEGVNCSSGLCCHRCGFLPSGYVCRQEENECDLPEYCNGLSEFCPEDAYKQDGTPCKYEGLCFNKGCRSRSMQCQNIFGPNAKEAPHQCYDAVNMIGDQFGNCGIIGPKYEMCTRDNTMCGRLQCINVKRIPDFPDHTLIMATYLKADNLMCWGTGYHYTMIPQGIPDIGMINDGTFCGQNQVCVNKTCIDSSNLNYDCLPDKCNGRGVCNSNGNCHCVYGWQPPFCEEVGFGGSVDSGPPAQKVEEIPSSFQISYIMPIRFILFIVSVVIVFFRQLMIKRLRNPSNPAVTRSKPV